MRPAVVARRGPGVALVSVGPLVLAALLLAAAQAAAAGDARTWLERMRSAALTGNYEGTMVVSSGGTMTSSRVAHYTVGRQVYERIEALDGRQQRVYRHNDEVRTLWPQQRVAVIERRDALSPWSTTPQRVEPRALEHYELKSEGFATVAGRDAAVLLLEPKDGLRFAQRLWADRATGLLLRADVLGPQRSVLETAAFSQVDVGVKPQPESVLKGMRRTEARGEPAEPSEPRADTKAEGAKTEGTRTDGAKAEQSWKLLRPAQRSTELEAEGWTLKSAVPGFLPAGCMARGIDAAGNDGPAVIQAVFSDGLTHVSLFIEPYKPARHKSEMAAQLGATTTLTQRRGEHWITAVGDVPAATLKQFVDALERRR